MKQNMKQMWTWMFVFMVMAAGTASSAWADGEDVYVRAKLTEDPSADPKGYFDIHFGDANAEFGDHPTGETDTIHVKAPRDYEGEYNWKGSGVYGDPVNDGAKLIPAKKEGVGDDDNDNVEVEVEGRGSMGSIYWVTIVIEEEGVGVGVGVGETIRWALVEDYLESGTLTLRDDLSGVGVGTDGEEIPVLYCTTDENKEGKVSFWLNDVTGTYNWDILEVAEWDGTLTADDYKYSRDNIDPGKYTLKVTDAETDGQELSRQIEFVVVLVEITDAEGNVLTEDQTTIVGKKIDLKSKITPEDIVVEQHQWTIGGKTVKNYEQSLSSGTKTDLQPGHLNDETVEFYWIAGHVEVDVKYEADISGISFESVVKYEVKRPTAELISKLTDHTPPTDIRLWFNGHQYMQFGQSLIVDDFYAPGITWEAEVTTPENGGGEIAFTQLARFELTKTLDDGTPKIRSSYENWVLDGGEGVQYAGAESIGSSDTETLNRDDSPGIRVTDNKKVGMDHKFHVYLMYKPAGEDSIWVTLRRLNQWHVDASATKENDTWDMDDGQSPPDNNDPPGSYDSDDLPTWDSNTSDYHWEVVD